MQYQFQNWYRFNWLSGSDPVQSVIHQIDMTQWALGEIAPVRARGLGGRQVCTDPEITWEQIMASKASFALPRYGWDVEPPVRPGADGRYPSPIPGFTKLT